MTGSIQNQPQSFDINIALPPPGKNAQDVQVLHQDGSVVGSRPGLDQPISLDRDKLLQHVANSFGYPSVESMESAEKDIDLHNMAILLNMSLQYPETSNPEQSQLDSADPSNPTVPVNKALLAISIKLVEKGNLNGGGVTATDQKAKGASDPLTLVFIKKGSEADGATTINADGSKALVGAKGAGTADASTGAAAAADPAPPVQANSMFSSNPLVALWMAISEMVSTMMQMESMESSIRNIAQDLGYETAVDKANLGKIAGQAESDTYTADGIGQIGSACMVGAGTAIQVSGHTGGEDESEIPNQADEMQAEQIPLEDPGQPPTDAIVTRNQAAQVKNEQISDNNLAIKSKNTEIQSNRELIKTQEDAANNGELTKGQRQNAQTQADALKARNETLKGEIKAKLAENNDILKNQAPTATAEQITRAQAKLTADANSTAQAKVIQRNQEITTQKAAAKTYNSNTKNQNDIMRASNLRISKIREQKISLTQNVGNFFSQVGDKGFSGGASLYKAKYAIIKTNANFSAELKGAAISIFNQNTTAATEAFKNIKESLGQAISSFTTIANTKKDSDKFTR